MATVNEIQLYIGKVLAEVKKKKEKADKLKRATEPKGYSYAESLDFSAPLGAYNLYRSQGAVNWGPMTGPGTKIDDRISGQRVGLEAVLRGAMKEAATTSAWDALNEEVKVPENIWEAAQHYYDHAGLGLGGATSESIEEKKIGFAKLKNKLDHKKGVKNPAALAASIGRTKYGKVAMAKKAAAGRK